MIGLADGAGRTSILHYFIQKFDTVATLPTIGFNVETIVHKSTKVIFRDAGGSRRDSRNSRNLEKNYKESLALIFAFDCSQRLRADEAC